MFGATPNRERRFATLRMLLLVCIVFLCLPFVSADDLQYWSVQTAPPITVTGTRASDWTIFQIAVECSGEAYFGSSGLLASTF